MLIKDLIKFLKEHDQSSRIILVDANQNAREIDRSDVMFVHQLNAVVIYTSPK